MVKNFIRGHIATLQPTRSHLLKLVLAVFLMGALLISVVFPSLSSSVQSSFPTFKPYELQFPHVNQKDFVLGAYRIQAPASFLPYSGQSGDPRRSRFLVLMIPESALGLPLTIKINEPNLEVVQLSLQQGDAERLLGYTDVIAPGPTSSYDGYVGHHLKTNFELYVAPPGQSPLYLVCPSPLGKHSLYGPMICNVDETVVSAAGASDLTVQYLLREDNLSKLPAISDALKSIIRPLITIH